MGCCWWGPQLERGHGHSRSGNSSDGGRSSSSDSGRGSSRRGEERREALTAGSGGHSDQRSVLLRPLPAQAAGHQPHLQGPGRQQGGGWGGERGGVSIGTAAGTAAMWECGASTPTTSTGQRAALRARHKHTRTHTHTTPTPPHQPHPHPRTGNTTSHDDKQNITDKSNGAKTGTWPHPPGGGRTRSGRGRCYVPPPRAPWQ